jgi:glycosyltransferase involved in cell wall biosynthesis
MGMEETPASVRLIVVGGGREAFVEPLKQRAQSQMDHGRIRFLGPLDDTRLRVAVARADVAVSPAEHGESFRSVLAEAMAAGLPVIATGLHPEGDPVVRDGINGHLVAPADARALALAIGRCASAPDELARLGVGARETAGQLTVERLVARILPLYHELLETHADGTA